MGQDAPSESASPARKKRWRNRWPSIVLAMLLVYLLAAYILVPFGWKEYAKRHPSFDDDPRITTTHDGHPGDPLNVALIGTEAELKSIMQAAGWYPAAALGLKSDLKIAADTVLSRPDDEAPVSNLYLFGRKEDLAFEKPVGDSPKKRNHVRFWRKPESDADGRPVWLGSATFDKGVGFSHTTGQITHHIDSDLDTERDRLMRDLKLTGQLSEIDIEKGFHTKLEGKNGGGDPWHTDGDLYVGVIKPR